MYIYAFIPPTPEGAVLLRLGSLLGTLYNLEVPLGDTLDIPGEPLDLNPWESFGGS